jgi:hypothetical protein
MGAGSKRDYRECSPSKVAKYLGLRKPACNGGDGCNRCQDKYDSTEAKERRRDALSHRMFGRP